MFLRLLLGLSAFALACQDTEEQKQLNGPRSHSSSNYAQSTTIDTQVSGADGLVTDGLSTGAPSEIPSLSGLNIVFYNLQNYRNPEPEDIRKADIITEILTAAQPDILVLCEIKNQASLLELQARLLSKGIDLPHSEHLTGFDHDRQLALLSRHPIAERNHPIDPSYIWHGERITMKRGILDVTVNVTNQKLRIVAAHLKSKLDVPSHSQEELRRNEAAILRAHLNQALLEHPSTPIILCGDFNDWIRTPTVQTLIGAYHSSRQFAPVPLMANDQSRWTHYWAEQDLYSRIDYFMISQHLARSIDPANSRIIDHPDWLQASDHRCLKLAFK